MSTTYSDTESTLTLSNCRACYFNSQCIQSTPNLRTQLKDVAFRSHFNKKSIFDGIKVQRQDGEEVLLSSMWSERPIILKVLARLGCAFCKAESRDLSDLQPYFEALGVGLVAVAFEDVDMMTFISTGYWRWDILIDPQRKVYDAAGLHKKTLKQILDAIISKRTYKMLSYLKDNNITNGTKGDFKQLGGTFLIDKKGHIIYQFKPTHTSTSPDLKEIYKVCGGDPTDLDGMKFLTSPFMFTRKVNNYLTQSLANLSKRIKAIYKGKLGANEFQ